MSQSLRAELAGALPVAMKERDSARVAALRTALAALANAEAVDATGSESAAGSFSTEVERRHLSEHEVEAIVREVHDQLCEAADEMRELGQEVRAAELVDQATALRGFLER